MSEQVTFKSWVDCGLFTRGYIKSQIERYCFTHDLSLSLYEDKGLLWSRIHFRVTGTSKQILQLQSDYVVWGKRLKAHT